MIHLYTVLCVSPVHQFFASKCCKQQWALCSESAIVGREGSVVKASDDFIIPLKNPISNNIMFFLDDSYQLSYLTTQSGKLGNWKPNPLWWQRSVGLIIQININDSLEHKETAKPVSLEHPELTWVQLIGGWWFREEKTELLYAFTHMRTQPIKDNMLFPYLYIFPFLWHFTVYAFTTSPVRKPPLFIKFHLCPHVAPFISVTHTPPSVLPCHCITHSTNPLCCVI